MARVYDRAELEALGIVEIESLCDKAGIDVTRYSKAELIDRLLDAEGRYEPVAAPDAPVEPPEPS